MHILLPTVGLIQYRLSLQAQASHKDKTVMRPSHYNDIIMSVMVPQITNLMIVYSTVYSRHRSKKTSKLRVTGLCEVNSPVTSEFPTQRASNAENVSIWWHHHVFLSIGIPILLRWYLCIETASRELTDMALTKYTENNVWTGLANFLSAHQSVNLVFI